MQATTTQDNGFRSLYWTQFLGALNDNLFKNALVIMMTFRAQAIAGIPVEQMVALCGGIFILPFFLFSATAGQMADKFSKSRMIQWIKVGEIGVMSLGALGFALESLVILMTALFLMGTQSAFFGPVKYSILPHLVKKGGLLAGNARVNMGTFIAILAGTILGGVLIAIPQWGIYIVATAVLLLAVAGVAASRRLPRLAPTAPELKVERNPITPTMAILKGARRQKSILLAILGISWFWFMGAAFLSLLPPFCKDGLHAGETVVTWFLALFSLGIGAGSLLCERLSGKGLELGLVPLGSFGMTLFTLDLFFAGTSPELGISGMTLSLPALLGSFTGWRISMDLLLFAISGGLFIVPLYTLIQERTEATQRSRMIAANNIMGALLMVASAIFLLLMFRLGLSSAAIFLVLSIANLLVAGYIYTVVPEFLFRLICNFLAKVLYRMRANGLERIPATGAAVLVSNHVSFIDWLIIAAASPRPVRFVMHHKFLKLPLTGKLFRDARVIPIAGASENPKMLQRAMDRIASELAAGELVCIFPEGTLTRDGRLNAFRRGIEKIVHRNPVPVIPMALDGLWGSYFSRSQDRSLWRSLRRLRSTVRLSVDTPVAPQTVRAAGLAKRVGSLLSKSQAATEDPLDHSGIAYTARLQPVPVKSLRNLS